MRCLVLSVFVIFSGCLLANILVLFQTRQTTSNAYWVAAEEIFHNNTYATNLVVMYPDGKLRLRIPMQSGYADRTPQWSSDGNDLYFTSFSTNADVQIYRTSAYHDKPELVVADGSFPAISPDSRYLAYSRDDQIEVRNLLTGQLIVQTNSVDEAVHYGPFWLSNNELLFFERAIPTQKRCIYQLNLATTEITPLPVCDLLTQSIITSLSLASNRQMAVIEADFVDEIDGNLILWDFRDNTYRVLVGDTLGYTSYGWSWDSRQLFTFDLDGVPYLHDIQSAKYQDVLHPHKIEALAWSPDNRGFYYLRTESGTKNIYWQNRQFDIPERLTHGTFDYFYTNPVPSPLIDLPWHPRYLIALGILLLLINMSGQIVSIQS